MKYRRGLFLVAVAEREEDWRAAEVEGVAEATFEVAFVAPVEEAKVATVDDEPWWAGVGLDHIAKLWVGVFKASRRMRVDGIHEELIEVGSL